MGGGNGSLANEPCSFNTRGVIKEEWAPNLDFFRFETFLCVQQEVWVLWCVLKFPGLPGNSYHYSIKKLSFDLPQPCWTESVVKIELESNYSPMQISWVNRYDVGL